MTPQPLEPVLDYARRLGAAAGDDAPDGELLRRFARNNDAVAFEQLLRRHGPMVRGVCRRVLRDGHDVDDAFQATFLLLVRKAGGLRQPDRLGPWLHGVALRTSLKARERTVRRRETPAIVEPAVTATSDEPDWRPMLDAAIARLPARERTAVVMCYLDGVTYAEAAQRLRCPLGTLAARLSRARDRLRARLTREGLAPSAEVLPVALAGESLPPALVTATVRGATALKAGAAAGVVPASVLTLMEGVQRAMLMQTWKVALAVLVVLGATGGGVGVIVARPGAAGHVVDAPEQPPQPPLVAATGPAAVLDKPREDAKQVPLSLLRRKPPAGYHIIAGDILGVYIEGVLGEKDKPPPVVPGSPAEAPATGYPIKVQENGQIILPLVGPLQVEGQSVLDVHAMISDAYVQRNILVRGKDRIIVSLVRTRPLRVTVVRRDLVGSPAQTVELQQTETDILNALVKSGGVPAPSADAVVVIQRREANETRVPLRVRAGEPMHKEEDVHLFNGDVVIVESRGTDQKPAPAADSPPLLTFAVASPDGRVLIQIPGAGAAGQWQLFDAATVTATESDGRAVNAKSLAERLKSMTTVLVATDGKSPTAAHLQAVKPGTLVLTVQTTH